MKAARLLLPSDRYWSTPIEKNDSRAVCIRSGPSDDLLPVVPMEPRQRAILMRNVVNCLGRHGGIRPVRADGETWRRFEIAVELTLGSIYFDTALRTFVIHPPSGPPN